MNIFGQVWLWSLLSFVAGVLLTWLVMVRPARKHAADLEDQLLEARSRPAPAPVPVVDYPEIDEWNTPPPRSLADEVLTHEPAPVAEPFAQPESFQQEPYGQPEPFAQPESYEQQESYAQPEPHAETDQYTEAEQYAEPEADTEPEHVEPEHVEPEPVAEEPRFHDQADAQRRFEEQLAEQRALAETSDDDRPRSLFERLSPGAVPEERPAEQTTVLPLSGLEAADFDEEPELPAEQTQYVEVYEPEPTADVAAPQPEPTAPPEVDEPADDFIYQPREVWAEQEQEVFLDEAAEQEDEPVSGPTQSEQTTFIAVEESQWPANDLTGEYAGLRDELAGSLDTFTEPVPHPEAQAEPEVEYEPVAEPTASEQTQLVEPIDLDAPRVHNGVLEQPQSFTEPEPAPEPEPAHGLHAEPETYPEPTYTEPTLFEPEPVAAAEPFAVPFGQPIAEPAQPFQAFGSAADEHEFQPRAVAAAFEHPVEEAQPEAQPQRQAQPQVERPRSLFEPLLDADEPLPPTGQTRSVPDSGNDQPFVPKFVPSDEPLLAEIPEPEPEPEPIEARTTSAGLPIREARKTTAQRQQSFPAFSAFESAKPKPEPTPAAVPARPRPVGFSPSTGGRPNGTPAGTTRYQQPEGFNPRSPFGPGSVLPRSDGHAPAADFAVKATLTGRRYYTAESANFPETRADVWFRTVSDAEKAGFRPAP